MGRPIAGEGGTLPAPDRRNSNLGAQGHSAAVGNLVRLVHFMCFSIRSTAMSLTAAESTSCWVISPCWRVTSVPLYVR